MQPLFSTPVKLLAAGVGSFPPVFCLVMLYSCFLIVFGYWLCLMAISYGLCPTVPLEASHTSSARLIVPAESTLGSQTEPPLLTTAIVLPTLILGVARPCGSTTTGSIHPGLELAGSGGLCRSEALSPFLATRLHIATLSFWSPNSSTIPISNRCLSPILVYWLAGLGPVVYPIFVTAAAHQGLNGDNLFRENLLKSPAKPRIRRLRLIQCPYPKVNKRRLLTGFTSPIGRREAYPFSENDVGEFLKHNTLICSLLGNSWIWAWLHLLDHSSILRGSRVQNFYWIFISKLGQFRPSLLSEIHIISSETFLGGSNCRHLKPQFHVSIRQLPPTLQAIGPDSVSNSSMESERKRASTALSFRLPIFLFPGSLEIHLVSRENRDGCRAGLFRLTGNLASIGFSPFFKSLSLGYFNVFSDYLKLSRAMVSRFQVKIIRGSLYFELVFPCNTSIPCFTALLSLFVYFTVEHTSGGNL